MKNKFSLIGGVLMIAAALALLPLTAQATPYTWTGTTDHTWETSTNWTGGAFPNSYSDQATIGVSTNNPVSLSTTALLGGGGTALTIGSGASGTAANLDIAGTGTLGMQGNIFITTPTSGTNKNRGITLEGILRNDGASSSTNSITGTTTTGHGTETLTLNGGTITTLNGGGWSFGTTIGVSGYGTISAPFTGTVTATSNNQALNITSYNSSPITMSNPTLAFSSTSPNGTGYYNLSNLILNGLTLSGTSGRSQFTNPLPNTYGNNWGNTAYGLLNVTGDTTINGAITLSGGYKVFNVVGSTLTLANNSGIPSAAGNTSSPPAFVVGPGGVVNFTAGNVTLGTSAPIPLTGGTIENTGTGTFSTYAFIGNGSVTGVTSLVGGGNVTANGGTLTFAAGSSGATVGSSSGSGANLNSSAGATLDVQGTYNYINPGNIFPAGGTVNFDNATFNANNWAVTLGAGAINVKNDSSLTSTTGAFNSSAALGINSGKTLNVSGTLNNAGTLAVGAGILNNQSASADTLGGGGNITLAGGSITGTGGGGFTSNNAFSGYGNLSTLFTNNGSMNITGGILNVSGSGQIAGTGNVAITDPVVTTGLNLQSNKLLANNFSMGANTTLTVAGASTPLVLTGNFSFGQTDPLNWTYGATTGLGPDLKMEGTGTVLNPQTLEVGGVYKGTNTLDGKNNNFALNSLTLGAGAYVKLVDFISNAGTAGSEVLYLGALLSGGDPPTLDLNGIMCFVQDGNGFDQLYNGETYQGINIVPIPPSAMLLGTGLLGLVGLGWRRKKLSQA